MTNLTNPLNRDLEIRLRTRYAGRRHAADEQVSPEQELGELASELELEATPPQVMDSNYTELLDTPLAIVYRQFRHLSRELANRSLNDTQLQDLEKVKSWYRLTKTTADMVMESLQEFEAAMHSGQTSA